jgi:hypothetical protein
VLHTLRRHPQRLIDPRNQRLRALQVACGCGAGAPPGEPARLSPPTRLRRRRASRASAFHGTPEASPIRGGCPSARQRARKRSLLGRYRLA